MYCLYDVARSTRNFAILQLLPLWCKEWFVFLWVTSDIGTAEPIGPYTQTFCMNIRLHAELWFIVSFAPLVRLRLVLLFGHVWQQSVAKHWLQPTSKEVLAWHLCYLVWCFLENPVIYVQCYVPKRHLHVAVMSWFISLLCRAKFWRKKTMHRIFLPLHCYLFLWWTQAYAWFVI